MTLTRGLLMHCEASRGWGGQEIRTLTECAWFRDQGYAVELVAREDGALAARAREAGFVVHSRPLRKGTVVSDIIACRALFAARQPLMVGTHSTIDSRACLAAAALANVPHRIRYRHVSIPVKASAWNRVLYRRLATSVITTAESIARALRESFDLDAARCQCIFTGVDAPELPGREQARLALVEELALPADTRFIGQVSILRKEKGHAHLMQGFDRIAAARPELHLLIVGDGHGREYLPPIAAELASAGRIHFTGHRADPWPLFRAMDVAALASTSEGVPQSGLQAMMAGTPFVGTEVGGIPEIVHNEHTGLLVPAEDAVALGDALARLCDDRRLARQLADNAFDWARGSASVATMGEKVKRMLAGQPAG